MGTQAAYGFAKAKNIKEAWKQVYENAIDEYGHQQGHSGQLNGCRLIGDRTATFKNMTGDQIEDWVWKNLSSGEAVGYCNKEPINNTNKVKTKVNNIPQKGTRKWVTMYVAETISGEELVKATTQTECIKRARKMMEQSSYRKVIISVRKELLTGNKRCAEITYKPSAKERPGEYYFIGLARS
jgi:hypothetical protein